MNDDSFRIPAHISLQEISLSLYQLIELEKGYEIAFNLQQDSTVKLFIAGEVIALASISIDGEKIKLKIIETFLKNNSEISDNSMSLQN
jgi:flagellar motor switch protein FliM